MKYLPGTNVRRLLFHTCWGNPFHFAKLDPKLCWGLWGLNLIIIKPFFSKKKHTTALNQWQKQSRSQHIFFDVYPYLNKKTSKCKKAQESSWRFLSSKEPLYILPCIGQIPNETLKKIGICVLSWRATYKKNLFITHKQ